MPLRQMLFQALWVNEGEDPLDVLVIDVASGTADIPQSITTLVKAFDIPVQVIHVVNDDPKTVKCCARSIPFWYKSGFKTFGIVFNRVTKSATPKSIGDLNEAFKIYGNSTVYTFKMGKTCFATNLFDGFKDLVKAIKSTGP
jgi:Mrp family chromosome partitioning ATPase